MVTSSNEFNPSISWLMKATLAISSIARTKSTSGFDMKYNDSNHLHDILLLRLIHHLKDGLLSDNKGNNHWVWQRHMRNLKQMAAILKLSGLIINELEKHLDMKECLFNQLVQ